MHVAKVVRAPVLLVGDIDRGGVFASFLGTMELLEPEERALISAFVVNKFRGDVALLKPGLDFLTKRTGKPVLGVIPYVRKLRVADEDSVSLDDREIHRRATPDQLDIAVIRLPRISNFDDVQPLEHETGVVVRFVERPEDVEGTDLAILPGSKNTVTDLAWLRTTGIAEAVERRSRQGQPVLGLCGGCQMLGELIEDPDEVESSEKRVSGLGLLPLRTRFGRNKLTSQIQARVLHSSFLADDEPLSEDVSAYEIHMGSVEQTRPCPTPFEIVKRNGRQQRTLDGAIDRTGMVVGTMLHGILENDSLRARLLGFLRKRKGLPHPLNPRALPTKQAEYDRLEAAVREHIDCDLLWRIARLNMVSPA